MGSPSDIEHRGQPPRAQSNAEKRPGKAEGEKLEHGRASIQIHILNHSLVPLEHKPVISLSLTYLQSLSV